MALTAQEQAELDSLRSEIGYGPLGEPISGVSIPTYSPEATKKTAMEVGAETLPMVGSIAATAMAPEVGIPARMALSGLGAGVGTLGKQAIETFGLQRPWQPGQAIPEIAGQMAMGAGAEGFGQLVGRGLSKAGSMLAETPLVRGLFSKATGEAEDLAAKQEVQRMLQRYNATLGIQEAAPQSTLYKVTERISRIGPTKAASAKDVEMRNAISSEVSNLADELTTNVLSREATGTGYITAQKEGRSALYKDYGTKLENVMDQGGALPVPLRSVQNIAESAIAAAESSLKPGESAANLMGTAGYSEAKSLLALKPELTFKQANEVRSGLLEKQREMEKGTVAYNIVQKAVNELTKAMDTTAEASSPALKQAYTEMTSGYKQAITELDPKILVNAAKKNPESIADKIIASKSPSEWRETQTMLNRAKSLGVDTSGLAENVQRAYLEKTFADGGITNVANKLKDKAFAEQFNAVLPEAVKNRAQVVAKAGQILGERGKAIDLATAATLSSAAGGAVGAVSTGDVQGGGMGAGAGITALILAPKLAAKIAYSPALTNKLLAASSDAGKGNTAAAAVKLAEMYRQLREPSAQAPAPTQETPSGLSAKEAAELEQLRKEINLQQQ